MAVGAVFGLPNPTSFAQLSSKFLHKFIQVPAQIRKPSMSRLSRLFAIAMGLAAIVIFTGCHGLVPGLAQLQVTVTGGGTGNVTSTPPGINCPAAAGP